MDNFDSGSARVPKPRSPLSVGLLQKHDRGRLGEQVGSKRETWQNFIQSKLNKKELFKKSSFMMESSQGGGSRKKKELH